MHVYSHVLTLFDFYNHLRKLKKPTFSLPGRKKKNTITVEPTIERTPINSEDPIMEDREDGVTNEKRHSSEERYQMGNERQKDDESVMTENNNDALSTVKEEPSKEEAEEKAAESDEPPPPVRNLSDQHTNMTPSIADESLTLDATATAMHENACAFPMDRATIALCGFCFGNE